MARPYRLQGENFFYHITSRGDNREKIYTGESDYKKFLGYLQTAKEKYKFYCYAYVLMLNHYHLLIETIQPNLSRIMQYINTAYTTYYNIRRRRVGHVFGGRYKSILVDKDSYFLELTRYIHLNPVRAKIVDNPQGYKWSSYKGYINKSRDKYTDKEQINKHLGLKISQYQQFVFEGMNKEVNPFENIYAGFILGKTVFIKDKLRNLKEQIANEEFAYKKVLQRDIEKKEIIKLVCKKYRKGVDELCKMKNRPMMEKKIAIYLIKRFTSLTNKEIGEVFSIGSSAISKVAGDVEKLMESSKGVKSDVEGLISRFSA